MKSKEIPPCATLTFDLILSYGDKALFKKLLCPITIRIGLSVAGHKYPSAAVLRQTDRYPEHGKQMVAMQGRSEGHFVGVLARRAWDSHGKFTKADSGLVEKMGWRLEVRTFTPTSWIWSFTNREWATTPAM